MIERRHGTAGALAVMLIAFIVACVIALTVAVRAVPVDAQEQTGQPGRPKPPESAGGIEVINYFRSLSGLAPVVENEEWSRQGTLHSRYVVRTGQLGHTEDPSSPHYTDEGLLAGSRGNVYAMGGAPMSPYTAVYGLMKAPFHAMAMLDPRLTTSSYGAFSDPDSKTTWKSAATIDVVRGNPHETRVWNIDEPVLFPGPGEVTPVYSVALNETPDPLVACEKKPFGAPIYLMMPEEESAYNYRIVNEAGESVEACSYDARTYRNPDEYEQYDARTNMDGQNAIVIIPMEALHNRGNPAATYTVAVATCKREVEWTFGSAYEPDEYTPAPAVDISVPAPSEEECDPPPPEEPPNKPPVITGPSSISTKIERPFIAFKVMDRNEELRRTNIVLKLDGKTQTKGVKYAPDTDRLTFMPSYFLKRGKHKVLVVVTDSEKAKATKTVAITIR